MNKLLSSILVVQLLILLLGCSFNSREEDKFKTITEFELDLKPLEINSIEFLDFLEDKNKNDMGGLINWVKTELIPGRRIIQNRKEKILCDRALDKLDKTNTPLNDFIVPFVHGDITYLNCQLSGVHASIYTDNPVQLIIKTYTN